MYSGPHVPVIPNHAVAATAAAAAAADDGDDAPC